MAHQQGGSVVGVDAPVLAVGEEIAGRNKVAAMGCEVPAGRGLEVGKRSFDVRTEGFVVECLDVDGLDVEILRHLCGAVVVEPLIDLPAPASLGEGSFRRLGASAELGVDPREELHHERRRGIFRGRSWFLTDRERPHVEAAVHEPCLDGREWEAVAFEGFDDATFEGPFVGIANER